MAADVSEDVAATARLDLGDLGPQIRQHCRRERPGHDPGQVQEPDAFKRSLRFPHGMSVRAQVIVDNRVFR